MIWWSFQLFFCTLYTVSSTANCSPCLTYCLCLSFLREEGAEELRRSKRRRTRNHLWPCLLSWATVLSPWESSWYFLFHSSHDDPCGKPWVTTQPLPVFFFFPTRTPHCFRTQVASCVQADCVSPKPKDKSCFFKPGFPKLFFLSQNLFVLFRIIVFLKEFCLCVLCQLIFTALKFKIENF